LKKHKLGGGGKKVACRFQTRSFSTPIHRLVWTIGGRAAVRVTDPVPDLERIVFWRHFVLPPLLFSGLEKRVVNRCVSGRLSCLQLTFVSLARATLHHPIVCQQASSKVALRRPGGVWQFFVPFLPLWLLFKSPCYNPTSRRVLFLLHIGFRFFLGSWVPAERGRDGRVLVHGHSG